MADQPALTGSGSPTDRDVRTVAADRRTVAYAEYGATDGVPVLFLHGMPGSRLLAGLYDEAARTRGVRLLAPDRPGYGRSDPWPDRTLADTASFTVPVLDDAGVDRATAVGFSGGGAHALALGATRGERVRSLALVSCAAPPECIERQPRAQRSLAWLATRSPRLLGGLLRVQSWVARNGPPSVVLSQYTDDPDGVPGDVSALVRQDFVEALARSRAGLVTESRLLGRPWDVTLDAVNCPVGLWHGERDGNVPATAARRLAMRLSDADLTVTDGADHLGALLSNRSTVLDRVTAGDGRPTHQHR